MIKALIFDMDDTLVNSAVLQKKSFIQAFKKHGADVSTIPPKVEKTLFGRKAYEIAEITINYFLLKVTPEEILAERQNILEKILPKVEPMPGLHELLNFLRRSNYKVALATSSLKRNMNVILNKFNMKSIFNVIVSGDEVKHGKPNPEIYAIALKKLNLSPKECVVIEDATNGIIAAKKLGMKTIGIVNTQFKSNQDLSMADAVIKNLAEVEATVKKLS
jgi:HAD superfamily hydrolase (TIGR01509 family)